MIVIVTGFGRCGSSLAMQMLAAGGMKAAGSWPSFEDNRAGSRLDPDWIGAQDGRAVKVLVPHVRELTPGPRYCFIWCKRDHIQQARSQVKFARLMLGLKLDRRRLVRAFRVEEPEDLAMLARVGRVRVQRFEQMIRRPHMAATALAQWAGLETSPAMAAAVIGRHPRCRPDLSLELAQANRALSAAEA